jgi:RND family efflux transporter MFP subunit
MIAQMRYSLVLLVVVQVLCGCKRSGPSLSPPEPPTVTVEHPVLRTLDSVTEFTGRIVPVESQVVQSQVTGYVKEIKFKDGELVQPNQVLYEIDPVPYQAALANAKAMVAKTTSDIATVETQLLQAAADYERARRSAVGTLSEQELDQFRTTYETAKTFLDTQKASLAAAVATEQKAQFDRDNCSIRNAVTLPARVTRTELTPGNLVVSGQTVLCKVTSLDPVFVYVDVDEETSLRYRKQIFEKKLPNPREQERLKCWIGRRDEFRNELGRWPHEGEIDYIAPELMRGSGTREVRGVLENPDFRLNGGDSVRVQITFGPPESLVTIPEIAVGSQQQQKFVYCVTEKDGKQVTEFRPIELGSVREINGVRLQVVMKGLTAEDRVIVNGLLRVRPGIQVTPVVQSNPVNVLDK